MSVDAGRAVGDLEPLVSTAKTPGELLREERLRRRLSVQQAAEDLHLDVRFVEAIEANNFLALGAPVYAKGHLRKYALLLGLAPDVVIARYLALNDVPVVPTPVPVSTTVSHPRERWSLRVPRPVVLTTVAILIAAAAFWGLDKWHSRTQLLTPEAVANESTDEAMNAGRSEPAPQAIPSQPGGAVPATGEVKMRLEFVSASWVEIYDAVGKRLMFDIGQPGQVRTISGTAPLKVTIGIASAVRVRVNDTPITLPRQAGKDGARFGIAADGSVR
jgi:cytoskeleton protein RodZ